MGHKKMSNFATKQSHRKYNNFASHRIAKIIITVICLFGCSNAFLFGFNDDDGELMTIYIMCPHIKNVNTNYTRITSKQK